MVKDSHSYEAALSIAALFCVVLFIVLHLILGSGAVWWLLAISTLLLALSDVVMRIRKR